MIKIDKDNDLNYLAVKRFYGAKAASRTGVPFMNHIDEGLIVLETMRAPLLAMQAYCLHPLVQLDDELFNELVGNTSFTEGCSTRALLLAMEYRSKLNRLSSKRAAEGLTPEFIQRLKSDIDKTPYLWWMAVADKVQNSKDFVKYYVEGDLHHDRCHELQNYFSVWTYEVLGLSLKEHKELTLKICDKPPLWISNLSESINKTKCGILPL